MAHAHTADDPLSGAPPSTPPFINRDIPCHTCGCTLTGLPYAANCPKCGTPVSDSIRSSHAEDADSSLALLFGALALVAPVLALLLAPIAAIFFSRALAAHRQGDTGDTAIALATVGLIMAVAGVLLSVGALILLAAYL